MSIRAPFYFFTPKGSLATLQWSSSVLFYNLYDYDCQPLRLIQEGFTGSSRGSSARGVSSSGGEAVPASGMVGASCCGFAKCAWISLARAGPTASAGSSSLYCLILFSDRN